MIRISDLNVNSDIELEILHKAEICTSTITSTKISCHSITADELNTNTELAIPKEILEKFEIGITTTDSIKY